MYGRYECFVMQMLWQAVLLFPPSATLIVQFHIEPLTGQHILDYSTGLPGSEGGLFLD